MEIIKPKEEWVVKITFEEKNTKCPYLVYPVNYHGCCFMHPSPFLEYPVCSKETCPNIK